jgi:hypothetical protein
VPFGLTFGHIHHGKAMTTRFRGVSREKPLEMTGEALVKVGEKETVVMMGEED